MEQTHLRDNLLGQRGIPLRTLHGDQTFSNPMLTLPVLWNHLELSKPHNYSTINHVKEGAKIHCGNGSIFVVLMEQRPLINS